MPHSVPEAADFAIELERPGREERDESTDGHRVDRGDLTFEAQSERRGNEPQSAREVQPFGAQMIAAEAEVRGKRERDTADSSRGASDIEINVVDTKDPRLVKPLVQLRAWGKTIIEIPAGPNAGLKMVRVKLLSGT